jgi:hypothetical protein
LPSNILTFFKSTGFPSAAKAGNPTAAAPTAAAMPLSTDRLDVPPASRALISATIGLWHRQPKPWRRWLYFDPKLMPTPIS